MENFDAALDQILAPEVVPPGDPQLPAVPFDYWRDVVNASHQAPIAKAAGDLSRSEKLEHIVDKAVDTIAEILDVEIDPFAENAGRIMSVKKDAAIAALNLAVKVDENHFRKKSASALVAILEKITNAERAELIVATPQ